MPADDQRLLRLAGQRPPLVPRLVELHLGAGAFELRRHPLLCGDPGLRPGHALSAVLVARQLAQLLQLGDGAGRVERHRSDANAVGNGVVGTPIWPRWRSNVLRASRVAGAPPLQRAGLLVVVAAGLWAFWEAFKWIGETTGFQLGAFAVNDRTLPHLHDIVGQLFEPSRRNGPLLIEVLWDAALFTAKEAAVGFFLGATIGFVLAVILAHSLLLQRGFLPYIVASQTVPILAIAPMVVIWLGGRGLPDWLSVSVIAAYLTFFPVTINTLRGLDSADPRALELMRSYAADRWRILWKVRVPASLPYVFTALKVSATASIVGAIIGELPASIQGGLGGAILNFNQYYASSPPSLWATNLVAAALGITFFLAVVLAEKLIVRRAPENVA